MSADLVDPFARPEPVHYQVNAYDICDRITYKVRTSQDNDRELMPQLIQRTLQRLRQACDDGTPEVRGFARWVLDDLWHRAVSGVPYSEPQEPVFPRCTSERCKQTSLSGSCRDCT